MPSRARGPRPVRSAATPRAFRDGTLPRGVAARRSKRPAQHRGRDPAPSGCVTAMGGPVESAFFALLDGDLAAACAHMDQAVASEPGRAELLSARAELKIRDEQFMEALEDATKAAEADKSLFSALLRKGIASFHLDEFEAAQEAFAEAGKARPGDSGVAAWTQKCAAALATLQAAPAAAGGSGAPAAPALDATLTGAGAKKYRHQWYQTGTHVYVSVFAKNIPKERATVDVRDNALLIQVRSEAGEPEYELAVQLGGKVDPAGTVVEHVAPKIEVKLAKADGSQWTDLQQGGSGAQDDGIPLPWASKRRPGDWSKLESEIAAEEKDEQLEGDAALMKLFKNIYKDADDDTRRAMMKSYSESGGTVLSTNWKEVGAGKVEVKPPAGQEPMKM
ncbi:unnamed protein product [Pedinophyceae sp. YPF-701]|nr:unnamed protein product [Pedinophyceae sp. YPF-701]